MIDGLGLMMPILFPPQSAKSGTCVAFALGWYTGKEGVWSVFGGNRLFFSLVDCLVP